MIKEGDYGKMWTIDAKRQMIQQSGTPKLQSVTPNGNSYPSNGMVLKTCGPNNTGKLYLLNNSYC